MFDNGSAREYLHECFKGIKVLEGMHVTMSVAGKYSWHILVGLNRSRASVMLVAKWLEHQEPCFGG